MPVPQQLPQVAILPARYPDLGKTILHQQLQNMLRILPIRLLLPFELITQWPRRETKYNSATG